MQLWVDADACPVPVKDVLFRVSEKRRVPLVLVANQHIRTPTLPWIRCVVVEKGFDMADNYLVANTRAGDLVVTQDIPLAAELVGNQVAVITPRGDILDKQNIGQRLSTRNLMESMRNDYQLNSRSPSFDARDKQAFANALDRQLARLLPRQPQP